MAAKTREQLGYDLIYWSNAFEAVLRAAARRTQVDHGGQQPRNLDGSPADPVGDGWLTLQETLDLSQRGGYFLEDDIADWRAALAIRMDYLTEQHPDTHLVADAAAAFERLEGVVRDRLGDAAPPRPMRYPPARQPL